MPLTLADVAPQHEAALAVDFDTTFLLRGRYRRGVELGPVPMLAGVQLSWPLFTGTLAGAIDLDGEALVPLRGPLVAVVGARTGLARASDARGRFHRWGGHLQVGPGVAHARGRVSLDLSWSPTFATHVAHSELVRDTFAERYHDGSAGEGPRDGWYAPAAGRAAIGASGVWTPTPHSFVGLGGAWVRPFGPLPSFPDIGAMPFSVHLDGGVQW